IPSLRARSGELEQQGRAQVGDGFAYADQWNDIQLQRDLPASAAGVVARERQHLCGGWQLLGSFSECFARLAAGVDGGIADAVSVKPTPRPAGNFAGQLLPIVDLDVGVRTGDRR